jgi:hypothetical protein
MLIIKLLWINGDLLSSQKSAILYRKPGKTMKPKPSVGSAQHELLRVELVNLVDQAHPLVRVGEEINWAGSEEQLGATYHVQAGAPGINMRLMVALHYLKYQPKIRS